MDLARPLPTRSASERFFTINAKRERAVLHHQREAPASGSSTKPHRLALAEILLPSSDRSQLSSVGAAKQSCHSLAVCLFNVCLHKE